MICSRSVMGFSSELLVGLVWLCVCWSSGYVGLFLVLPSQTCVKIWPTSWSLKNLPRIGRMMDLDDNVHRTSQKIRMTMLTEPHQNLATEREILGKLWYLSNSHSQHYWQFSIWLTHQLPSRKIILFLWRKITIITSSELYFSFQLSFTWTMGLKMVL